MSTIRFEQTAYQRRTQLLTWTALAVGLALMGVSLTSTLVSRHYRAAERSQERQIASLAGQVALLRSGGSVAWKSSTVATSGPNEAMRPASSPYPRDAMAVQPGQSRPVSTGATAVEARSAVPVSVQTDPGAFPVAATAAQLTMPAIRPNMAVRRVDLPEESPQAGNARAQVQEEAARTRAVIPSPGSSVPAAKRSPSDSRARDKGAAREVLEREQQRQAVSATSSASNAGDAQPAARASSATPPARATVSTPLAVEAVSQSQAQVADLSSTGVRMKSGLTISIGGKFPSGEKLIAVDPAKHQIVTDQRTIVLMP